MVPLGDEAPDRASRGTHVALQRVWPSRAALSSIAGRVERFLDAAVDRAPWLAVAFAAGIGVWFVLDSPIEWFAALVVLGAGAFAAVAWQRGNDSYAISRRAVVGVASAAACGLILVWAKSSLVGVEAIDRPGMEQLEATILAREEQVSRDRVRLTLATWDRDRAQPIKVRVNVPLEADRPALREGARIALRARLMPPSPPIIPGGYDFARTAWFDGLAASGSVSGSIEIVEPARGTDRIASLQRRLSAHVRERLDGSPGAIAATLASGDRGAIAEADQEAMRDSGLTHLLSISGLHVSAVVAAAYLIAIRLLALWPWLALRVRLPLVAAAFGALAGIGYTLLTGAEVPTVRACIGAVLVLTALALGRDPLSLRLLAAAAIAVLALWPEALVGPSFQMSFAAVIAIIALHQSGPVRAFLAPREEAYSARLFRRTAMLLATGVVIELTLMPIVLFQFHRAGVYGAFANVIAIPLVTFLSMPLIALALFLDLAGLGAPAWWAAGKSLELLLALAHATASLPGSVKLMPQIGLATILLIVFGGLWLALWRGRVRLYGLVPIVFGVAAIAATDRPDILISGDGRHVGIVSEDGELVMLRDTRSEFTLDNFTELAGVNAVTAQMTDWPGARCSSDFCSVTMRGEDETATMLVARSREMISERALAAACERADIVVADRYLPRSCRPRWLKADRRLLSETGGLAIDIAQRDVRSVADAQGDHGWWR